MFLFVYNILSIQIKHLFVHCLYLSVSSRQNLLCEVVANWLKYNYFTTISKGSLQTLNEEIVYSKERYNRKRVTEAVDT